MHATLSLPSSFSATLGRVAAPVLLTVFCLPAWAQGGQVTASQAPVVSERVISGGAEAQNLEAVLPEGQAPAPRSPVRSYQEDAGSRIEELRVRGETQEITVKPAGNMPAYEVRPANSRSYPTQSGRHGSDGTNGPRRWKIGEF